MARGCRNRERFRRAICFHPGGQYLYPESSSRRAKSEAPKKEKRRANSQRNRAPCPPL